MPTGWPRPRCRGGPTSAPAIEAARRLKSTAIIEFRVEQEDTVYPMVPAGADLHAMIRRPSPLVETAEDA
jgi:acetolactate synthase-1/2/3 large subunit